MDTLAKSATTRSVMGTARRWFGASVAAMGIAVALGGTGHAANIVVNGGFETPATATTDFPGWLELNNFSLSGVFCGAGAPQGNCAGFFGPSTTPGTLSQVLNTQAGRVYNVSFDFAGAGDAPSTFSAMWGSQTLLSLTNPLTAGGGAFQVFNFLVQATGPTTTLAFNFRDDPGFMFLDAVAVTLPEPASVALLGIGLAGLWAGRRRKHK